tara:strand:- start:1469 stop:2404 length:936 start_codon:yes stop_codon:yes gene_type:complete
MNFLKKFLIILFLIFLNIENSYTFENKILFKVENEIITTIDIYEEIKFLKKFNPEINSLNETDLFEISKNSILKDRIKKIEIMNFANELKVDDKFLLKLIKSRYSKISFNTLEDFENYLKQNNLDTEIIREKFTIELMWNDLIYQKFYKKIIINKEQIKKDIINSPHKEKQKELLLSEIVFTRSNKVDFKNKYEKILLDIDKIGFKKAALIHSESSTASSGGLIGWVKVNNLNKTIKKIISKLEPGQFSEPIRTSSGFIIIKIEEEKEYVSKLNLEDKVEEVVIFKTNEQLDQFSNMYFNKLKKDLTIYDL